MIALACAYTLGLSILICTVRLWRGPKLADRVVAMDLVGILFMGMMIMFVNLGNQEAVYLDVAVVLALVTFLGTVVFARFLQKAPRTKAGGLL